MKNKPEKQSEDTRTRGSNPGGRTIVGIKHHFYLPFLNSLTPSNAHTYSNPTFRNAEWRHLDIGWAVL